MSSLATFSAPHDGPGQLRGLAATVPDELDIGRQQTLQSVHFPLRQSLEEAPRQLLPLLAVRFEPGPSLVHVTARPDE